MLAYKAQELHDKYLECKNIDQLAKENSCSRDSIKAAIKLINPNIKWFNKTYELRNKDYFSEINTSNKAYILGFIAADGCLLYRKYKDVETLCTLTITLNKKDIAVLEFIKKELGCDNPIMHLKTRDQVRFVRDSEELCKDLLDKGITPRKSLTLENMLDKIPKEFHKAFLLGYFDRDGSIYNSKEYSNKYAINIRGTEEFLQSYNTVFDLDHKLRKYDATYIYTTSRKSTLKTLYSMYTDNPPDFFLERKHKKFLDFLKDKCQDETISSP